MFLLFLTVAMSAAPVDLQSCRVAMAMPAMADKPAPAQPLVAGVAVTFVNHAPQAATQVTFSVSYANRTELMTDRGNFSPAVQIKTMFPNFAGVNYWRDEPDACSIVRVQFADGTVWSAHDDRAHVMHDYRAAMHDYRAHVRSIQAKNISQRAVAKRDSATAVILSVGARGAPKSKDRSDEAGRGTTQQG